MSVFENPWFDDHEHVAFVSDAASGLRAVIAIHRSVLGMAGGGCRMWPYASTEAAVEDALRLSRAMSWKLALAGLPSGGAKAVVIGDPARDKSEALLRALGRAIHRLGGRYIAGEDVGTSPEDMAVIARETPFVMGRARDSAPATARGVVVGMRAAVRRRLGRDDLRGLRVAVQGAGHVGGHLCALLVAEGARVFVSDIDPAAAARVPGATPVEPDALFDLEVDVFAPCALGAVLDDRTIPRLRCAVVAGAANEPLGEPRHAAALAARGVLFAPDFVINAGGALEASAEGLGAAAGAGFADERIARIGATLDAVFDRAEREGVDPFAAAERMARERLGR